MNPKPTPKAASTFDAATQTRLKLDREIVARVSAYGRPVKIADMFEGFTPTWAANAAARAEGASYLTRDKDGRYAVTDVGRALLSNAGEKPSNSPKPDPRSL